MTDTTQIASHYRVDDLEIDAGTREVRRGAEVLDLPGLSFDLFLALVRAAPDVLNHDELEQRVWNGRSVSPETLTQRVKLVRDALGEDTESPRYIAVVRGRGYRLIATVEAGHDKPVRRVSRLAIIVSVIILIFAMVLVVTLTDRSDTPKTIQVMAPELPSIAVLFFDDLSENKDQEHFSNGMSETMIRELARVTGLKVIAKTSSFYFKDKEVRITDIANELKVRHILEGSVQKAGNRIRVTAQLIDAAENSTVWSENFDRDLVDIFSVQDEIAQEVVEALKVTLLDTEITRLAQRYRPSLQAYEQVILGSQQHQEGTVESMAAAERHFKLAIEIDPGYALAYVSLASTYKFQRETSGRPMSESITLREPLLKKALELDPLSGEAYAAIAYLHYDRRNFELAERDFLKAIALNPNYATARQWYSSFLYREGRFGEALAQIQVAADLDPIARYVQSTLANALWASHQAEEALTVVRQAIDRYPENPLFYMQMAFFNSALGNLGESQRWQVEARKRNSRGPDVWRYTCRGFLNLGDVLSTTNCVNQFSELYPEMLQPMYIRHLLLQFQGDNTGALTPQEEIFKRTSGTSSSARYLADDVAGHGDIKRARRLMADALPELLEDDVELRSTDLASTLVFAAILHANGETERRDVLLLAMEVQIATMHRIHGYAYGILDVYIHAMRGDRDRAIAGLREAINMGWRVSNRQPQQYWWRLRSDWKLEGLHRDPEFIELVNELETDIAAQRQWYEENKDKPLF